MSSSILHRHIRGLTRWPGSLVGDVNTRPKTVVRIRGTAAMAGISMQTKHLEKKKEKRKMSICPTVYLWFQTCLLLALCLYRWKLKWHVCPQKWHVCPQKNFVSSWSYCMVEWKPIMCRQSTQHKNTSQFSKPWHWNWHFGHAIMQFSRQELEKGQAVFNPCLTFCTSIIIEYLWWARMLVSGDVLAARSWEPLKTLEKVKRYRPHVRSKSASFHAVADYIF